LQRLKLQDWRSTWKVRALAGALSFN